MNAAPVVSSITFDQPSYAKGDLMTATVNYSPGTSDTVQQFTGTATDETTNLTGQLTVTFVVAANDPTTLDASDNGGHTWTPVSDDGAVAVFTAKAQATVCS